VPVRTIRTLFLLAVATLFTVVALWGQAPKQNWKDRAEYDLYEGAMKATDNNKKLELLNTWNQKYAASDYKMERLLLFLNTYNALGNAERVMQTGSEVLSTDPKNLTALYLMTLNTVRLAKPTPELLKTAENAARTLVTDLDALRPAATPEADWNKGKPDILALGHLSLGWIGMQRKENEAAEKAFVASLQANAANAQVSYWLASVMLAEKNPDKNSGAIYHFIRAGFYAGPGALPEATRKQIAAYVTKLYNGFHGSAEGFEEIRKTAQAEPFPTTGFKIASKGELDLQQEEEFKKANPMLALWQTVKKELTGPNGATYFDGGVKGALLPGGAGGIRRFKAKLVAAKPPKNPKELVLSLEEAAGDITLVILDEPLVGSAPIGTELEFEGVPTSYTASPYMLTFEVDQEKQLAGWPVQAAPAKKGGPPAAGKKAATKAAPATKK
jgi:hypothetical protein